MFYKFTPYATSNDSRISFQQTNHVLIINNIVNGFERTYFIKKHDSLQNTPAGCGMTRTIVRHVATCCITTLEGDTTRLRHARKDVV